MKNLCTFLCLFFLLTVSILSQEPTDAGIPDANHVLVVYNSNSSVSDSVMQYYVAARGIPDPSNIVPLRFPDTTFAINGITHTVGLAQETDNIRDFDNHNSGTWYATEHAWKYFFQFVALPINNWITSHNLTSTIRYIVLCKGVPFKVQAGADSGGVLCNVTVDGLLCMLNTYNYEGFLHDIYTAYRNKAVPPPPPSK